MMKKFDLSRFDKARTFEIRYLNIDELVDNNFVKRLRRKLNMTQLVFASVLGVTKKTVEKWEQGKNPVKGTSARFLYLLDLKPELISKFYVVKSYNIEITYDVESEKSYENIKIESVDDYLIKSELEGKSEKKIKNCELLLFA